MTESRETDAPAKGLRPISLDAINFLLADVRGALGPYLNVFLVTRQHWSLSEVGLVTTVGGLVGLALQTPAGALIDWTRATRGFVVAALAVLATGATVIALWPTFWPVLIANSLTAVVGDIFSPAIAALTLGLVARKQLARRIGRNSAFDHAGNVVIAALAGLVGWALYRGDSDGDIGRDIGPHREIERAFEMKAPTDWSAAYDAGNKAQRETEMSLTDDIAPGRWNRVTMVLACSPATPGRSARGLSPRRTSAANSRSGVTGARAVVELTDGHRPRPRRR